jgi:hypothetical protein
MNQSESALVSRENMESTEHSQVGAVLLSFEDFVVTCNLAESIEALTDRCAISYFNQLPFTIWGLRES